MNKPMDGMGRYLEARRESNRLSNELALLVETQRGRLGLLAARIWEDESVTALLADVTAAGMVIRGKAAALEKVRAEVMRLDALLQKTRLVGTSEGGED